MKDTKDSLKAGFNAFAYFFCSVLPFGAALLGCLNTFDKIGYISFKHLPIECWIFTIVGILCTFCILPNLWYYFNDEGMGICFRIGIWPFFFYEV